MRILTNIFAVVLLCAMQTSNAKVSAEQIVNFNGTQDKIPLLVTAGFFYPCFEKNKYGIGGRWFSSPPKQIERSLNCKAFKSIKATGEKQSNGIGIHFSTDTSVQHLTKLLNPAILLEEKDIGHLYGLLSLAQKGRLQDTKPLVKRGLDMAFVIDVQQSGNEYQFVINYFYYGFGGSGKELNTKAFYTQYDIDESKIDNGKLRLATSEGQITVNIDTNLAEKLQTMINEKKGLLISYTGTPEDIAKQKEEEDPRISEEVKLKDLTEDTNFVTHIHEERRRVYRLTFVYDGNHMKVTIGSVATR